MDYAEQKGSVKGAATNVDIYHSVGKAVHFLHIYAIYGGTIILHHDGEGPEQGIIRISRKKIPQSVFGT